MTTVYAKAGISDPELIKAYEVCRRIIKKRDPDEYALTRLSPHALRPALWALWASIAVADDLVDTVGEPQQREAALDEWTAAFETELKEGISRDSVRHALVQTVLAWNLSPAEMFAVLRRFRQDVRADQPATWREWGANWASLTSCAVHSSVGLASAVWQVPIRLQDLDALRRWSNGTLLTDSLVDLADDIGRAHLYWPVEAFQQAGVEVADLLDRRWTPGVEALVDQVYRQALAWLDGMDLTGLPPWLTVLFDTFTDLYRARLHAAYAAGPVLLRRTSRLPRMRRWRIIAPARIRAALAWYLTPIHAPTTPPAPLALPGTTSGASDTAPKPPFAHPSGARPPALPSERIPQHVAIIMDGNGRWAAQRGLPRTEGHRAGEKALRDVIHGALEIGLSHLTVFAFSTENWKRSPQELDTLLSMVRAIDRGEEDDLLSRDVRLRWAGSGQGMPTDVLDELYRLEDTTRHRTGLSLTLCINYGGRAELAQAAGTLARAACAGQVDPARISEHILARYLPHPDLPDVDLLWRTSGEHRTSNFLPWQATYAELHFTDTLWPDIDRRDLWEAVNAYATRERRYGTAPRKPAQHGTSTPVPACTGTEDTTRDSGPQLPNRL